MNEDTHMLYEALANDSFLYWECEGAARHAGAVSENAEDFARQLAVEIQQVAEANREFLPGFSLTEPIELENVDYTEIASEYEYEEYS